MAAKEVIIGEQSRQTILRGINVLADAVKVTLGQAFASPFSERAADLEDVGEV
jgi:hypothetical protein